MARDGRGASHLCKRLVRENKAAGLWRSHRAAVGGSGGRSQRNRGAPRRIRSPPDRVRRSRALGGIATCAHSDGVSNRGVRGVARRNARLPAHLCASTKARTGCCTVYKHTGGCLCTPGCFDYHPASLSGRAAQHSCVSGDPSCASSTAAAGWSRRTTVCKHKQATRLAGRRPASASGRVYQSSRRNPTIGLGREPQPTWVLAHWCAKGRTRGGRRPLPSWCSHTNKCSRAPYNRVCKGVCPNPVRAHTPAGALVLPGPEGGAPDPTVGCKHQGAAKAQPQVARSFHSLAIPHAQPPTHNRRAPPSCGQGRSNRIPTPHRRPHRDPFGGSSTCFITVLAQRPAPKM